MVMRTGPLPSPVTMLSPPAFVTVAPSARTATLAVSATISTAPVLAVGPGETFSERLTVAPTAMSLPVPAPGAARRSAGAVAASSVSKARIIARASAGPVAQQAGGARLCRNGTRTGQAGGA